MNIKYREKDKLLILEITEEIDHHISERLRGNVDYEIQRRSPKKIVFDFNSTSFMDSAGIGLVIGRYKMASMIGAKMEMINVSESIKRVFEMTGVLKIIPIIENSHEYEKEEDFDEKVI